MSEFLICHKLCIPRGLSLIRPCAKEIYEENQDCIDKIKTDPSLDHLGAIIPYAGMDELINHTVEIQKSVESEKNIPKKILVASVSFGAVTLQF